MTDKEYREQKARIDRLIKKWVRPIGLGWWHVSFTFKREALELDSAEFTGTETCPAKCHAHWQYLDAHIEFGLPDIMEMDDDRLEMCVVHELCHVFVNEMRMWAEENMPSGKRDEAMRHEERVVTQLTNALLWARRAGVDEGKRGTAKGKAKKR